MSRKRTVVSDVLLVDVRVGESDKAVRTPFRCLDPVICRATADGVVRQCGRLGQVVDSGRAIQNIRLEHR